MQALKVFLISMATLLFSACDDHEELPYTYALHPETHDTINVTNEKGRQGYWLIQNGCAYHLPRPKRVPLDTSVLTTHQSIELTNAVMPIAVEMGHYLDNKRQGLWTYYDPYGDVNKMVEFEDDVPVRH